MIAVIQCAGSKRPGGHFVSKDDERVLFVAQPERAPTSHGHRAVHPDAFAPDARSWRQHVLEYNKAGVNSLQLYTASELYEPPAYRRLVSHLGAGNVYILSAGWGLVRSDFLLPQYDITFTPAVKKRRPWTHRSRSDTYNDFCHLPKITEGAVHFFGGKDYVRLFCDLTHDLEAPRTVYFNSITPPRAPQCHLERFPAKRNMNWHYDCVDAFLSAM